MTNLFAQLDALLALLGLPGPVQYAVLTSMKVMVVLVPLCLVTMHRLRKKAFKVE